jgi:hypothetical protein
MMSRIRFLLSITLVVVFALSARAQSRKEKEDTNTRSLQGTVTGPDDAPIAGAVVQLKDMRTLQVRSYITQEGGTYHFSGLKADTDYQVKADYNGASSPTRTLSVFDTRRAPVVNLKLEKK